MGNEANEDLRQTALQAFMAQPGITSRQAALCFSALDAAGLTVVRKGIAGPEAGGTEPQTGNVSPRSTARRRRAERERLGKANGPRRTEVIRYLNEALGANYRVDSKQAGYISARLVEGYAVEDLKIVIDLKAGQWRSDPKMAAYLRPSTLFNGEKFEAYLQEARLAESKRRGEQPSRRGADDIDPRQREELRRAYESKSPTMDAATRRKLGRPKGRIQPGRQNATFTSVGELLGRIREPDHGIVNQEKPFGDTDEHR